MPSKRKPKGKKSKTNNGSTSHNSPQLSTSELRGSHETFTEGHPVSSSPVVDGIVPPKKEAKGKKKKASNNSPSHNTLQLSSINPRGSQYEGFTDGHPVTSSPEIDVVEERYQLFLRMAREEYQLRVESINSMFDGAIALLESDAIMNTAVWGEGDLVDETQSLLEVHSKRERKVSWATPEPVSSASTGTRRRSKSAGPPSSFKTGVHMTGLSATSSYPDFRTPLPSSDHFNYNIALVTPHPNITANKSSILRKPKLGETAVSMSGSPLLVSSDYVAGPSVTVPMADGRVFNVLGNSSHDVSEQFRSALDSETVNKLKNLKRFINQLVP